MDERIDVCPLALGERILGTRWTMEIVHHLREPKRFCELQELAGGVNPRTLSQRLKTLEEEGIIERRSDDVRPFRPEYGLTAKGEDLLPVLDGLVVWVDKWVNQTEIEEGEQNGH
jgi:DNA-binding HxlR family transcriptional regulator